MNVHTLAIQKIPEGMILVMSINDLPHDFKRILKVQLKEFIYQLTEANRVRKAS